MKKSILFLLTFFVSFISLSKELSPEKIASSPIFTSISADEILSLNASTSIVRGSTTTFSVTYTASKTRDITAWLQLSAPPWTSYRAVGIKVAEGTGTVQLQIHIPPDALTEDVSYHYQVFISPEGEHGWSKRLDLKQIGNISVIDGIADEMEYVNVPDEIISVNAPKIVENGSTIDLSVEYSASTSRDIIAWLQLSSTPYTSYRAIGKNVSGGTGIVELQIHIPSDALVGEDSYHYQVLLNPMSQHGWPSRLDVEGIGNIDVMEGDAPPPTRLIFLFDTAGNQVTRKEEEASTSKSTTQEKEQLEIITESQVVEEVESLNNNVALFPNPTAGTLTMQWQDKYNEGIQSIVLTDVVGRKIQVDWSKNSIDTQIDLTSYAPGLYLVTFNMKDGTSLQKKIIKK